MLEEIEKRKLVAVLTVDKAEHAVPAARALLDGGVSAVELTLRTDAALEALARIRRELPGVYAGAGTVLSPSQVREALDAGALFGVAPGTNPRVLRAAAEAGLAFAPGVATPSDIETALENGCTLLKYFPASGFPESYLNSMAAPYRHLGVKFIPLGGVNPGNLRRVLSNPLVAAAGGSWLADARAVAEQRLDEIRANASAAAEILKTL